MSTKGNLDMIHTLNGTLTSGFALKGKLSTEQGLNGQLTTFIPYTAGNGIVITNKEIALDNLILNCGTSTTNIWEV